MRKTFEILLPDQPGVETTSLGKKVVCTYEGPRYAVISIDSRNVFQAVEATFEDVANIKLNEYVHDGHTFHVIDAEKHTLHVAYFTHNYTHTAIPDYEEKLPTGEIYIYPYPDTGGILDCVYAPGVTYNPVEDSFSPLKFLDLFTEFDINDAISRNLEEATRWVKSNRLTDTELAEVNDYINKLKSIPTRYPGVDSWKIPWPFPPPININ